MLRSSMLGSVFLHLATESISTDVRRATLATLADQASKQPELTHRLVSLALVSHLEKEKHKHVKHVPSADDEDVKVVSTDGRLCAFYLSCGSLGADLDPAKREPLLVDLVVLGHHPAISKHSTR